MAASKERDSKRKVVEDATSGEEDGEEPQPPKKKTKTEGAKKGTQYRSAAMTEGD